MPSLLEAAIRSAIGQTTHRDVEVIVVDDGSSDKQPRDHRSFGSLVPPSLIVTCSLDFHDALLADAELYGGPAFVQEVVAEANAAAEAACPWDGTSDEPAERHSVWLAAA